MTRECDWCGADMGDPDSRMAAMATRSWCSDECYERSKAEERRPDGQRSIYEVPE